MTTLQCVTLWARFAAVVTCGLSALVSSMVAFADTPDGRRIGGLEATHRIVDVGLSVKGTLRGQLLTETGKPANGQAIELHSADKVVARTVTEGGGEFVFENVAPGFYHLRSPNGVLLCRVWAPRTAPPHAVASVLLVEPSELARGQRPFRDVITNPLVVGTTIAAAIAVPIIIHNSGSDANGS